MVDRDVIHTDAVKQIPKQIPKIPDRELRAELVEKIVHVISAICDGALDLILQIAWNWVLRFVIRKTSPFRRSCKSELVIASLSVSAPFDQGTDRVFFRVRTSMDHRPQKSMHPLPSHRSG